MVQNIKYIFTSYLYSLIFFLSFAGLFALGCWFFDYELSLGNVGSFRTYLEIGLHFLVSGLFALFLAGQIYKMREVKCTTHTKKSQGLLGGLLGFLVVGCPSCSISIASYIGLSGLLSLLPWKGLEVKILAILLLLWTNYSIYKNLLVCNLSLKKK